MSAVLNGDDDDEDDEDDETHYTFEYNSLYHLTNRLNIWDRAST